MALPSAAASSAYAYPLLIGHLLHTPLAVAPQQEIVYRDQARFTYRLLRERIGRLASALSGAGVQPGDTVAVLDWDSNRYLEAYFAVPMMGAVLHTVNIRLAPEQILYTINHAQDDVILIHRDFLPILEDIWDRIRPGVRFILLQDEPGEVPEGFLGEYEALLASADPDYVFADDLDENAPATIFYTTGTTGEPKGVCFSQRQIVLHTLGVMAANAVPAAGKGFHRGDVYFPLTPMFHVHAWGMPYVATLMGVKQVYAGKYTPETLCSILRNERPTFSHCVPTILHMLLSSPAAADLDLDGWKVIIGGSALPRGLAQAALDRGIDVISGYGMSETCPVLTLAQADDAVDAEDELLLRCRTGRPIPLVDLRVVDEEMRDVPTGQTGEVVVRAPWLAQCYVGDPDGSERLWRGGYLHTGDVGYLDERGYLQVTDRLKDVIKSGGEWISSLQLEDLISQHPAVAEVAVVGVPDEQWGERPVAAVSLRAAATPDEILEPVQRAIGEGYLQPWVLPRVCIVEAIPKTSVGKFNKRALRRELA